MSVESNKKTLRAFIEEFVRETKDPNGVRYCFILGAGASRDSGVRMAGELAIQWLKEIHDDRGVSESVDEWLKSPEAIDPDNPERFRGFEQSRSPEYYFSIYDLYCAGDPGRGYRALNQEIDEKEPSFGYSVLAQILTETKNKVVVTVNFDNLVADALFMFSGKTPLVCAHESLAGFVPVVATGR